MTWAQNLPLLHFDSILGFRHPQAQWIFCCIKRLHGTDMWRDPWRSPRFTLTVREDIVVCNRGRGKVARRPLRVQVLQSEPLSAAVDPGSPPHCGRRGLHHLTTRVMDSGGTRWGRSCKGTLMMKYNKICFRLEQFTLKPLWFEPISFIIQVELFT